MQQCSIATGHIPRDLFPPPLYGELRSYLPPEARVATLAIMLYAAGVTPWSWAMREPDWLLGPDPDVVTAQRVQYAADKAAHDKAMADAMLGALREARIMAATQGRELVLPPELAAILDKEQSA